MALVWVLCMITLSRSSVADPQGSDMQRALPPPLPAAATQPCLCSVVQIKYPVELQQHLMYFKMQSRVSLSETRYAFKLLRSPISKLKRYK